MNSIRHREDEIEPVGWTEIPGGAIAVAASPDGSIWVLSSVGSGADRSIWHYANAAWTNIPGAAMRLAVAPDGTLWVVNSSGGIYSYDGAAWSAIAGGASDISVGADGSVYVISNQGGGPYGRGIWRYAGGAWTQLPGAAVRIAASWDTGTYPGGIAPGGFYVTTAIDAIYYYNPNTGFTQIPGGALQIAATTGGGLFALGYRQNPDGSSPIYYDDLASATWSQQPGAAISVATSSEMVYAIGAAGGIYAAPMVQAPPPAGILIDAHSPALATLNKDLFGANLTSSMDLTNANGTYGTMMTTFRQARFGMVRWPLALESDYYHWETNSFSSCAAPGWGFDSRTTFDQFMQQVAQPLGLDVNITVNYGSNVDCTGGGDPNEAAAWVNYANNQMHYGIKYWTIGNEQYFGDATIGTTPTTPDFNIPPNSAGALGSATYANLIATRFYPLMKAQDPTIQVGIDLAVPENSVSTRTMPWDATVLAKAKFDFVEVHWYGASPPNVAVGDGTLLTGGDAYFISAIADLRSELAAAGKQNTPIYVGEWGLPGPNGGSPQSVTIVGAMYTALALGEFAKVGIPMAGIWEGFDSGPCPSSPPGDYSWQSWFTSSLFEAVPGGTNPACPSIAQPPYGTSFPRANAVHVVQQALNPGDTVFAPTVGSTLTSVRAYGARRSTGYGVLLVNIDQNNAVSAMVDVVNDPRAFAVSSLVYGKAQYDDSQHNVWTAPASQTLGTVSGSFSVTLPPWSVTALTLSTSTTPSVLNRRPSTGLGKHGPIAQ